MLINFFYINKMNAKFWNLKFSKFAQKYVEDSVRPKIELDSLYVFLRKVNKVSVQLGILNLHFINLTGLQLSVYYGKRTFSHELVS